MSDRNAMSSRAVIRLVAGREINQRLRVKSFYITTGLLVLFILAVGVVTRLAGDDDAPGVIDVAVVLDEAGDVDADVFRDVQDALEASAAAVDRGATVQFFDDIEAAQVALEDGDVDVAIDAVGQRALFDGGVDQEVFAVVQQAWALVELRTSLSDAGLEPEQIDDALTVTPLAAESVGGDEGPSGLAVLTGTLAAIMLFLSLQTFGTYVLTGVVEEKSSAVVEVLLVRARADQLLAGKVIGIGVAALTQFALAVAAGMVSLGLSGVTVPSEVWSALPITVLWFLGGFALYSTLFALAGSLVSRQEEAQTAAAPIMYALVAAYLLVFIFGYVPESMASTIMSLIPPIAPLLMPMRMAAGAASLVEVVVALVLLLAATVATWKLAARIYEQVLLRRGSRISWREALRLLRPERAGRSGASAKRK
ncbi:MAG: ABC transporter permease [Actinomycetota bacterium]|nr:ABC transporter permease [Actinomycetota bacterium]